MNSISEQARILIATDIVADGEQLLALLQEHFDNVALSSDVERGVQEFEAQQPDVLVLAFETIAEAQRFHQSLNRPGTEGKLHPHRTILLCNKDEVPKAFELCKQQHFDDYVLYWPQAYDGLRLPMSVWLACSQKMKLQDAATPQRSELREHAGHMAALEQALQQELGAGEQKLADAVHSLARLELDIAGSHDELARRLGEGRAGGPGSADESALPQELARMKDAQLAQVRLAREQGVQPASAWAAQLRHQIEPALKGAGMLAEIVRGGRSRLLVVDDDSMIRDLVSWVLRDEPYDIQFAIDGPDAIRVLKSLSPDVILTDIGLPGLDGIALTRLFKTSRELSTIPVIIMTGDARRETVASSINAGAAAFVVKPFTRDSLKKKLEEVLAH